YDNLFNQPTGVSLKTYYNEVSYNQFTIGSTHYPDCAMTTNYSYTDSHPRSYFEPYNATTNPTGYTDSQRTEREHTLLKDAINWINANSPVPAALNIDGDSDNRVDNVCFIIRGGNGAWASLLWAHRWALYSVTVNINGKRVYDYTFQPETQVSVNILCHEMFHALGAPDLYRYTNTNISPVGSWDLMESGSGHMGAYMKWEYTNNSWIAEIPEITTSGTYTLQPLTSATNNCYKIASPNSTTEFFMLEYRRKTGTYETNIPGSGLLVYRIDPAYNGNASGPPDEVYIYRPNGTLTVNGSPGSAHYSSETGRTSINDGTNPSSFLQNGGAGGLNIYNVTSAGSTISFTVGISTVSNPTNFTATGISENQINLAWQKNGSNNNVVLAYSTTPTFGAPVTGTGYTAGSAIPGGGSVIYAGNGTGFNHLALSQATTYYYKLWSVDGTVTYSNGISANATTSCGTSTLPYTQTFSSQAFPACWTQQVVGTNVAPSWSVSESNNAGGSAFEMISTYQNINPATTRLVSLPFNTTGISGLNISFRHFLDDYGPGATLRVQSSANGTTWTNEAWSLSTVSNANVGPVQINTTILNNLNSATTYIAFTIEGNLYQYDYWYIDDITITAASVQTYNISTSANPLAGGSTTGSGSYNSGTLATVTAVPNTGYNFTNWTENGNVVSSNAAYSFTVSGNRTLVANFVIQQFTITASANPGAGGSTTGGGNYNFGAQATLTAIPNTGYNFTNWTESGNVVSTDAAYSFTVSGNRTLVANFVIQQFTISASANPGAGGSTTGGGNYNFGAQATVTAIPNPGYNFTNWTESGNVVSTDAAYSFTVSGNRTLVANFTIQQFNIATSSNPAAGGSTSGGGNYNFGTQANLNAIPNTGYYFTNWTENGNVVSSDAAYSFTVSGNRTLVANFTIQQFNIATTSNPAAGGSTSGSGNYNYGAQANLNAIPNTGYNFTNWTESGNVVSTDAAYSFTVNGNRTLVANFTIQQFNIATSSNPVAGGSTSGSGNYNYGAQASLNAIPNTGYNFANWTESGNVVSSNALYSFTVIGNRTLVANFTPIQYTITVSANPATGGSVSGGGVYDFGSQATLTAIANSGWNFINWTENGNVVSLSSAYAFTVSGDRNLVANFTQQIIQYTIITSSNPTAGGTTSGSGVYDAGAQVTVVATPNNNWLFINWTENGTQVSANQSYSFIASSNRNLVANFGPVQYNITVSANPANAGTVTGGGSYNAGSQAIISASPLTGYSFLNWTENGNVVSTNVSYTFTVTGNHNFTANFEPLSYSVTTAANPVTGGNTGGSGTYDYGTMATVTATANNGWNFINWTENGNIVSTNSSFTFTVTGNRELVANFSQQTIEYTISTASNPVSGGITSGGGTYNSGSTVTVLATPNNNWIFINWTENGSQVSVNQNYSFIASSNRNLVANFAEQFTITTIANPGEGGYTTGSGIYVDGETARLEAFQEDAYIFMNWMEGGLIVSVNPVYTFTVNGNRTLTANFFIPVGTELLSVNGIKIYPNPSGGIVSLESVNPESPVIEMVKVFSITGKEIWNNPISTPAAKIRIDLSQYPEGIYFFMIKPVNQKEFIEKVIITR
ncbi:MAG: M6 family metalloprotease domain-containing protein, partial [Lentimicrobium sp.]|nr:M6 family metalloprotease domain-containing protein [Lentimicrobium sp.]